MDYSRISKLRYELYDLKKEHWFELCGTCVACKDEGQRLELKEKETWHVDEVKRVKAIVGTVVWTRTRLLKVEYKQWKSSSRKRLFIEAKNEEAGERGPVDCV